MPLLSIDIEAKFAQFTDSLDRIARQGQSTVDKLTSGFKAVGVSMASIGGGLSVALVTAAFNRTVSDLAALDDAAEKTGATVEELSNTFNRFRVGGGTLDELTAAATRLVKAMQGATEDTKGAGEAFAKLGVKTRDEAGNLRSPIAVMEDLAKALERYQDGANKTAIAQAIFGKSGAELLPKLKDLAQETAKFGTVTAEQAAKAEELEKAFRRLSIAGDDLRKSLVSAVIPTLERMVTLFGEARRAGVGFFDSIQLATLKTVGGDYSAELEKQVTEIGKLKDLLSKEQAGKNTPLGNFVDGASVSRLQREIAQREGVVRILQQQVAAQQALNAENYSNEGKNRPKPVAPRLDDDNGAAKGLAEAQQRLQDAISKIALDAEKARADARIKILETQYRDGLISEQQYWDGREAIIDAAFAQEIAVLDKQAKRQTDFYKSQAAGTKEQVNAYKELVETLAKRQQLEAGRQTTGSLDDLARSKAASEYAKTLRSINAEIQNLEGNSAEGALLRFGVQYEEILQKLVANGDQAGIRRVRRLQELTAAQAAYNDQQAKAAIVEQNLAAEELRIRTLQETGAISDFEALQRVGEARQRAVPQLEAIAEAIKKIPGLSPKLLADADTFTAKVDQIAQTADVMRQKVATTFQDSFASAFTDFVTGAKTASDAFASFAKGVLNELIRIEARMLASKLFGNNSSFIGGLFGLLGGGNSSASLASSTTGELGFATQAVAPVVTSGKRDIVINVNHTNYIDSRSDQATINAALAANKRDTIAAVKYEVASGKLAFR